MTAGLKRRNPPYPRTTNQRLVVREEGYFWRQGEMSFTSIDLDKASLKERECSGVDFVMCACWETAEVRWVGVGWGGVGHRGLVRSLSGQALVSSLLIPRST